MVRGIQITFDCADPAALAAFCAEALGYRLQDPPEGFASWEQALVTMGIPPERRNDTSAVTDPREGDSAAGQADANHMEAGWKSCGGHVR